MKQASKKSAKIESKSDTIPVWLEQSCFNKDWILRSHEEEYIKHFVCLICKQVANSPVELECQQHMNADESLVVGEHCLKLFLRNNKDMCPVQAHEKCEYSKSKAVGKCIGDLKVMCIRQFEQELQVAVVDDMKNEGENSGVIKCKFKGKLKDLNSHLNTDCPLHMHACWFKTFGCTHACLSRDMKEHLAANMQEHFDLATRMFQSMKEEMRLKDEQLMKKDKQLKEKDEQCKRMEAESQKWSQYLVDIENAKEGEEEEEEEKEQGHDQQNKEKKSSSAASVIIRQLRLEKAKLIQLLTGQDKEGEENNKNNNNKNKKWSEEEINSFASKTTIQIVIAKS
ncbi:hypothetical protein RFI_32106 [Reticulomyxa filosa]|uniref:TRAF-type domain-containing protein n=1 Tax=Reticulomyxa filosa TaxID=46433 RepID=X6LUI4_RETFI|nr:hypothetical protein RFI_32106 [Reticulomyxa filosa]|eukprot:ETO05289.1 hypothetical protein RFI_32106 [Reticulomyxa filosa]